MNEKVKYLVYCALFACIIAVLAQLKIELPGLVPITLQTLGVYIVGCTLPSKYAFVATLVYVLMGAIGLPVFAGSTGGMGVLLGPSGGYIFSFPVVAACISVLVHIKKGYVVKVGALCIGTLLCYFVGTAWFMYVTNNTLLVSLTWCVFPFILGDSIKIGIAVFLTEKIKL